LKSVQFVAKRKKYISAGQKTGRTAAGTDKEKTMSAVQQAAGIKLK